MIIAIVIVAILAVIIGKCIHKSHQEKIAQMGYTQYDLSEHDLFVLHYFAGITILDYDNLGKIKFDDKYKYNPNKTDFELRPGKKTKEFVEKFNYELFVNDRAEELQNYIDEKYGINKDNQFSVNWILTHPKEFVEIHGLDKLSIMEEINTLDENSFIP